MSILWSSLASYTHGFFEALASRGVEIQLIYLPGIREEAPYAEFDLSKFREVHVAGPGLDLEALVEAWAPELCLMVSWNHPGYRRLCRRLRKQGVYVVCATDNQWRGTLRQRLGVLAAPLFLRPAVDAMLVPGDRQANFMRRLGFKRILSGWYAIDRRRFPADGPVRLREQAFLFVGRLVREKGLAQLLEGYEQYRKCSDAPWPLKIAGVGPEASFLRGRAGVEPLGFLQTASLSELLRRHRCLFLPSHFEPWGVIVNEAASCGLAIVASRECGSAATFVRHGHNGFIVDVNAQEICASMRRLESLSEESWARFARNSQRLADGWTMDDLVELFIAEFCLADRTGSKHGAPS
jgi:glycosyltransferase involved in cell wall biosynthesis